MILTANGARACVLHIPKNACTSVRATLLAAAGLPIPATPNEIHVAALRLQTHDRPPKPLVAISRDPASRYVSAILDMIVAGRRPRTWQCVTRSPVVGLVVTPLRLPSPAGELVDINALTPVDFARVVALLPDFLLEAHLRSQAFYRGESQPDDVVSMSEPGWQDQVASLLGVPFIAARQHATSQYFAPIGSYPDAARMTFGELRGLFCQAEVMPCADDLLTAEMRELLRQRFAADYRFIAERCPGRAGG